MTGTDDRHQQLMSEIIAKQAIILGPEIAVLKARSVAGLKVDDGGMVISYQGDPEEVIKQLIDEYVNLSGAIVKSALNSVFAKFPEMKKFE